jgi:nucleotide-binding universal stress UspA family protein
MMIQTILIPSDGSSYAKTSLKYGIYIAQRLAAKLTCLHVVDIRLMQPPMLCDLSGSVGIPPYPEFLPVEESGLENKANAIMNDFKMECEKADIPCETKKAHGIIDESIIEEGQKTDWILLAQRGEHLHIGGIGSTAESVLRKAGRPVLVTPQKYCDIESMASAYDGSPPAKNALKLAAELSQKTTWPLSVLIIADDQETGAKLSGQVEDILASYTIDSDIIILGGPEDRSLLRFIKEGSVELLVMGAYGHNRLRELLLGSTTNYIIKNSPIPVLLQR